MPPGSPAQRKACRGWDGPVLVKLSVNSATHLQTCQSVVCLNSDIELNEQQGLKNKALQRTDSQTSPAPPLSCGARPLWRAWPGGER